MFFTISSAINPGPNFFAISPCIQTLAQLAKKGSSLFFPTKLEIIPLKTSPEPITANSLDACLFITTFLISGSLSFHNFNQLSGKI